MSYSNSLMSLCMLLLIAGACRNNPKVIEPIEDNSTDHKAGIFSQTEPSVIPEEPLNSPVSDIHTVVVREVLPTVRYVYLRVSEGKDEFWIATLKREVDVGGTYYYQGGLLKTNFESREHKRTFERMYLVSSIIEADHVNDASHTVEAVVTSPPESNIDVSGSIKIADLVDRPEQFEGKLVQVTGECVKVNANIMGRNWLHLKDGSKDEFDLVITSDIQVPVGHRVTLKGKVALNKDFGAGYHYAILLEHGEPVR